VDGRVGGVIQGHANEHPWVTDLELAAICAGGESPARGARADAVAADRASTRRGPNRSDAHPPTICMAS